MRPRIGVTAWHRPDSDGLERWEAIRNNYTGAVRTAGGLPLILPIGGAEPDEIGAVLDAVDGLLFSGGEDVSPTYYGEQRDERCEDPDPDRDLFEIALARAALARRTPAFGICRGLQVINVAAGGTLYQDLTCRPGTLAHHAAKGADRRRTIHTIRVLPGSKLRTIMGVDQGPVTSTHHQFVKDLAPGFRVSAESVEDGIVEGIECPDLPYAVAVQWHPERLYGEYPEHLALFKSLIKAAQCATP